ncbi:MAG: glycogen-binding domain-containing protein [Myxococcaceae bacterium]|nr:glycogen-binding domain-containing protein [Myxococcaceae bacterium]
MSSVRKHTVSMSCLAPAGQFMELVGDFPDWQHPIAMSEVAPGDYQCSVALLPGVYRYKFRINQRLWLTVPRASLIDA